MIDFEIKTQKLPNGIVAISVKGFLDAYTYRKLEQTINGLFKRKVYRLIADLSQVNYISSAGVEVFTGAMVTAQENNGDIIIIAPKPNVIFRLLGLSKIFTITNSIEHALRFFD
ncbi:Anti-sigma-B factor antagonist [subsurface metagenome]